jgi:20S proteasome alpha/beta subunit
MDLALASYLSIAPGVSASPDSTRLIRRKPLKHDMLPYEGPRRRCARPAYFVREQSQLTVCVACLFNWIHGENDTAKAVVTASDRQLTLGDVEYEPRQIKVCYLTPRVLILVAGDYALHSEALMRTQRRLMSEPEASPGDIAELYASCIRDIKFRYASNIYLAPLGLTPDKFYDRQIDFDTSFLTRITNQLQDYQGPLTEAIIAGSDDSGAHLYLMDQESKVNCHNDVGFAAIGTGAWHARSLLMQAGYSNQVSFPVALSMVYAAKKRGEVAPGVGKETDMVLVRREGWENILPHHKDALEAAHSEFEKQMSELVLLSIKKLGEAISQDAPEPGDNNITQLDAPRHQSTTNDQ